MDESQSGFRKGLSVLTIKPLIENKVKIIPGSGPKRDSLEVTKKWTTWLKYAKIHDRVFTIKQLIEKK